MSTPAPVTIPPADTAQRILEEFVVDNADLEQLEFKLRSFNLFEALNLVWREVRHSDLLAYLLNPAANHGLTDRFLKSLLQSVLKDAANRSVTPIEIDVWNLDSAEIYREWQNIDIFVRDEANKLAVIIENKVQSEEHSNQLARYYKSVSGELPGWRIVAIFLTKGGETPSDERYISFGYDQICQLIDRLINASGGTLDPGVRTVIEHYADMLRRHIVTESEISNLCQRIYHKHKQALDLIYEHRPDTQQLISERLTEWIKQNPDLESDHCTKATVRFVPKELDSRIPKEGDGWTPTRRILLFEVTRNAGALTVKLWIGPGQQEIRQRLFDLAHANKPPLQPQPTLYGKYSQIFSRRLLPPKWYEVPEPELIEKLQKEWSDFVEKDLRSIVAAMKGSLTSATDASAPTLDTQAMSPESGNKAAPSLGAKTEAP
jgi:PD-(D/E)XK nuclease superfamily